MAPSALPKKPLKQFRKMQSLLRWRKLASILGKRMAPRALQQMPTRTHQWLAMLTSLAKTPLTMRSVKILMMNKVRTQTSIRTAQAAAAVLRNYQHQLEVQQLLETWRVCTPACGCLRIGTLWNGARLSEPLSPGL